MGHTGAPPAILEAPAVSYEGLHFYRHTFAGLDPNTTYRFAVTHRKTGASVSVEASTLDMPPGKRKLSIGVMSDIHLPLERVEILE